ncbi:MAG: NAD(P)(+) transhydrogenase (Re/Si-specific) subunit beta, partial [Cyanobacteria bacterium P01_E01_bin.43]
DSPMAGMPVLEVWQARHVVVLKRSLSAGYAGVANPLFYKPNVSMLFGDARSNVSAILSQLTQTAETNAAQTAVLTGAK